MKICSGCNLEQSLSNFYKDVQKIDGLRSSCKTCRIEYLKNKRKDPLCLEKFREASRKNYKNRKINKYSNLRQTENEYRRKRYASDPEYRKRKINHSVKTRANKLKSSPKHRAISQAIHRVGNFLRSKSNRYSHQIGCVLSEFILHIESQFQPGMSWANYGEWHIDHKFPLSKAYDLGESDFIKACNFKNLQPLWAIDNIRKSNKIS